jgi:hypothetical protein
MSKEQKAKKRLDSMVEHQSGGTKKVKSAGLTRVRRLEERRDRPLNVLGCFALIHAIRSVNSGTRRSTVA